MSKIKVGDWVKCQVTEDYAEIHRIAKVKEKMIGGEKVNYCFNTQGLSFFESELEKLPIIFKPFEINKHGQVYAIRFCKSIGKTYQFLATNDDNKFSAVFGIWYGDGTMSLAEGSKPCKTIEEAKDWLELQYTTLIAKARGLV